MNQQPRSPLGLRLANTVLKPFNHLGLGKASLDPNDLLRAARKKTGFNHIDQPDSVDALDRLCKSLEQEANLTPMGRIFTREMLISGLCKQLELKHWIDRHPEILDETITAPVVIIGMPRTGTTILHELMALDPANRVPQTWEVAAPFPPPEPDSYASDARISEEAKRLKVSHYLMPSVENMHRMGEQLPQECVAITADVFMSMLYNTVYHIPSYAQWLAEDADMSLAYRYHKRMLQLLQWKYKRDRWVIKSPGHLWSLPELIQQYPDAKLIQTHRDPLKIVSSLASMLPTMRSAYQSRVDVAGTAREWAQTNSKALNASMAARKSGAIDPNNIVDIQFREMIQSPELAVERAYKQFGLPFSEQLATAIQRYVSENPADKHGGHKHHFSDTGLNVEEERQRVEAYQAYFAVPDERLS